MIAAGATLAHDARAEAARPPDHELRRHERDRERDARARRAAGDGACGRGGGGDGAARVLARPQHRHAVRRTGSKRCCSPAASRTRARSRSSSTRSAPVRRVPHAMSRRILDLVDVTVLRGNAGEVATLIGAAAEVRGVESIAAGVGAAELARTAAQRLGVDRVGHRPGRPRERRRARARDRERS